ncbi:hypothetical protein [Leptothermofonsia sichuanensis]|nr:hypothetical protein [Leptothermofonsia sichuanensis]
MKVRVLKLNKALKRISLSMGTGDRATDLLNRNSKDRPGNAMCN